MLRKKLQRVWKKKGAHIIVALTGHGSITGQWPIHSVPAIQYYTVANTSTAPSDATVPAATTAENFYITWIDKDCK